MPKDETTYLQFRRSFKAVIKLCYVCHPVNLGSKWKENLHIFTERYHVKFHPELTILFLSTLRLLWLTVEGVVIAIQNLPELETIFRF